MDTPTAQAEKFGKYEIIRKLSRSMTDVYLARDSWTSQKVVIKKIEKSTDDFTRMAIEAETRGAQIQRQLHAMDPRILEIFEVGELGNFFFVAMEYCEGKNLAEVLQQEGRLDARQAVRYALEICSQLKTLHSFTTDINGKKIATVHGDIKPSNIQIGMKGDLRLLDFGISKTISATQNLTRHNMGSPSYCSPERLSKGQVDFHADLWAVGVTLFEMLAGSPPYQAQDTRQLENIIQSKRPPRALPEDCPAELKAIVAKALAGDIEQRYHSAAEFEVDLRAYLAGHPVAASRERVVWDSNATIEKQKGATAGANPTVRVDANTPRAPQPVASAPVQPRARNNATRLTTGTFGAPAPPPAKTTRWSLFRPGSANVALALAAGVLAGLMMFIPLGYFWRLYNEMAPLRATRDYVHDSAEQIDSDWNLYQSLKKRTEFLGTLSPVRMVEGRLRSNLLSAADVVIDGYRGSASTTLSDFDWARARKCLQRAVQMDEGDNKAKGKMALCDGYLNMVKNPKSPKMRQSLNSFQQAASYLPKAADPHLGLARLYVYGFRNVAQAEPEFQLAEQLGYHLGPREQMQKADGYMYRSEFDLTQAKRAAQKGDKDQANEMLTLAQTDLENARKLYEPLVGFANVNANMEELYQDRNEQNKLQQTVLLGQPTPNN